MNKFELKYTLLSIAILILAMYILVFVSPTLGIILSLLGIFFGIKSTNQNKPKWIVAIILSIGAIIIGWFVAGAVIG